MYQGEMRKRISEHSQRVIQNNECERRLLNGRIVLMNREHLRQLRNHDIEMLQLKHEIKMFNNAKREITNETTNEGAKLNNRPSTVELIRLVPNKMTRSRTFAPGAVAPEDTNRKKSLFPQLEETTRETTRQNSKFMYEQTASDGDSKDVGNRGRSYTNEDQVVFRKDNMNSYLDKSVGNTSSVEHLPELPKHLQRYDHRRRPTDDSRMNGTFKTQHGASATQLSMVHSIAWLSFRERQNVMTSAHDPESDDGDHDDDEDQEKTEQSGTKQSAYDTSRTVQEKSNLISASDSALYSSRFQTGLRNDEDDVNDDELPTYRSQYLSYYSLNRPTNFTEVKKTENDLMNMMTRSKIKFGQGRHIAARIERRRLLRSWNARSLPTSQNTEDD